MEQSTIRAFQRHMSDFQPVGPFRFDEQLAVHRFFKKYERPDDSRVDILAQQCWDRFLTFDSSLPNKLLLPDSLWYKARSLIHSWMKDFRLGDVDISNGSAFTPTRGYNSVAQKLRSQAWDFTPESIDVVVDSIVSCRALQRALEKRFRMLCKKKGLCSRKANKFLFNSYVGSVPGRLHWITKSKLLVVGTKQYGSRFSTVVKNNEKRRPINLECLLNMICQRRVGNGLRSLLLEVTGLDLDTLSDSHRQRISSPQEATIDLQDASDSVSIALIEFLFPRWFVDLLEQCRSPMVLGPDGNYHCIRKISSMGNGFTFELMTVVLTAVCKSLDPDSSVFGDDIVIKNQYAPRLIEALTSVGFVVNEAKSFVNSPFRESCGANYHDDYGYIESYDLEWPETIGDCVMIYNKVARLSRRYASFEDLKKRLLRAVPLTWRGPSEQRHVVGPLPVDIPNHFATGGTRQPLMRWTREFDFISRYYSVNYHVEITPRDLFVTWRFENDCVGRINRDIFLPHHWHRYFMYLSAGGAVKDTIVDSGRWVSYLSYGTSKSSSSWKSMVAAYKADKD